MNAEDFAKAMGSIAKAGISVEELAPAMDTLSKAFYKLMVAEIKMLASRRNISFKEAETIYLGNLDNRELMREVYGL